jgi:exodeoxyribonuclease-3
MKLLSWNINGLRAVLSKGLQDWLIQENADVYCFQEIKALPEQVEDWVIPNGYEAFWNPAEKKGYSGTLTLSRSAPDNYAAGIGEPVGDAEGRVQTLEFPDYYLVNVYTPNAKGDLSRLAYRTQTWDVAFREYCAQLAERKPVIFCGDLNVAHKEIDLANPKSNRRSAGFTDEERAAFSAHLEVGFVDTFRHFRQEPGQYSWWSYRGGARSRNVGWRIDYVCVSSALTHRLDSAFIQPTVMGSDHCPVGVTLNK